MECFLKRVQAEILNLEYAAPDHPSRHVKAEGTNSSSHFSRELFVYTPYAESIVPTRGSRDGQLSHLEFCLN